MALVGVTQYLWICGTWSCGPGVHTWNISDTAGYQHMVALASASFQVKIQEFGLDLFFLAVTVPVALKTAGEMSCSAELDCLSTGAGLLFQSSPSFWKLAPLTA